MKNNLTSLKGFGEGDPKPEKGIVHDANYFNQKHAPGSKGATAQAHFAKKYHDLRSGKPKQQQHDEAMSGVYTAKSKALQGKSKSNYLFESPEKTIKRIKDNPHGL